MEFGKVNNHAMYNCVIIEITQNNKKSHLIVNKFGCGQDVRLLVPDDAIVNKITTFIRRDDFESFNEFYPIEKYFEFIRTIMDHPFDFRVLSDEECDKIGREKFEDGVIYNMEKDDDDDDDYDSKTLLSNFSELFVAIEYEVNILKKTNYMYYYAYVLLRHIMYKQGSLLGLPSDNFETQFNVYNSYVMENPGYYLFSNTPLKLFSHWRNLMRLGISNDMWRAPRDVCSFYPVKYKTDCVISNPRNTKFKAYIELYDTKNPFNWDDEDFSSRVLIYTKNGNLVAPKKVVDEIFTPKGVVINKNPGKAKILSRHPSHNVLRNQEELTFDFPVTIRLGSTTVLKEKENEIKINSIEAIQTASNKRLMKEAFCSNGVKTPNYFLIENIGELITNEGNSVNFSSLKYPIIVKNIYGSRGKGNYKLDSEEKLTEFCKRKFKSSPMEHYIFEEYKNYAKEYRVHVTESGSFLSWRKLRRKDTPEDKRWFFNNENCNWASIANELFDLPPNWKEIENECVKALKAVGLDIGGCDVRVANKGDFSIIEINSACSLGEVTAEYYINALKNVVNLKIDKMIKPTQLDYIFS